MDGNSIPPNIQPDSGRSDVASVSGRKEVRNLQQLLPHLFGWIERNGADHLRALLTVAGTTHDGLEKVRFLAGPALWDWALGEIACAEAALKAEGERWHIHVARVRGGVSPMVSDEDVIQHVFDRVATRVAQGANAAYVAAAFSPQAIRNAKIDLLRKKRREERTLRLFNSGNGSSTPDGDGE